MGTKKQPEPIDMATVVGLSDMTLAELQELQPICAQQELDTDALLAVRQASGAELLRKRDDLQLAIAAGWDTDTAELEAELLALLPRLNTLSGMLQSLTDHVDQLVRQARSIAGYISQHRAEQGRQERAAELQAELDARAAERAEKARQFQADKLAAAEAKKKTAKADAARRYYEPLS